jgi:hypothetical protein
MLRDNAPVADRKDRSVIDENTFGVLLAHYDLESIEYSLAEDAFLAYIGRFLAAIDTNIAAQPLGDALRRIDLGHAVYLEFADGDQLSDPIAWVRGMRQQLVEADLPNICVLTAGGRWISPKDEVPAEVNDLPAEKAADLERKSGAWRVNSPRAYGPSEALRKALAAEAFAQPTTSGDSIQGWGPGLYIDKDAVEQLGKSLKNAPTTLPVLSGTFYRIGG